VLSAVVLTKNSEGHIADCIASLTFCDDILVLDDNSADKTVKIAKKMGANVLIRALNDDFAAQRNYALGKVKGDWVLFVDSDEIITKELGDEIVNVISDNTSNTLDGYFLKRQDIFLGHKMHYGEFGRTQLLRLARKNTGSWKRSVHEYWDIAGETGKLSNVILHYSHKNLKDFISSVNRWSTLHTQANSLEGKKSNMSKIIFMPVIHFIKNYLFGLGFLDGMPGFVAAVIMSFHSFLSWSKLWMLQKGFTKI
jgi:glycosyltransferase involved in cell wall biosynthesis